MVTKPTLVVLEQLNKQKERKDKSKGYAGASSGGKQVERAASRGIY